MEYVAVAELLRRRFDVYMTLVDDQGIDCVVRQQRNGKLRYLDLQIKARSKDAKQAATFAAMEIPDPRKNFWFIFYSEAADTFWVMPSLDLVRLARQNKSGKNAGKYTIVLAGKRKGVWVPKNKYKDYAGKFEKLDW